MAPKLKPPRSLAELVLYLGGREEAADYLGMTPSGIQAQVGKGYLPANCYLLVQKKMARLGIEAPTSLFNFKTKPGQRSPYSVATERHRAARRAA